MMLRGAVVPWQLADIVFGELGDAERAIETGIVDLLNRQVGRRPIAPLQLLGDVETEEMRRGVLQRGVTVAAQKPDRLHRAVDLERLDGMSRMPPDTVGDLVLDLPVHALAGVQRNPLGGVAGSLSCLPTP